MYYYEKSKSLLKLSKNMLPYLDNAQMEQLHYVLSHTLWDVDISKIKKKSLQKDIISNEEYLDLFTSAKKLKAVVKRHCAIIKQR